MDDQVVPPSITDYISRVLPAAVVHKLPYEGHFSYFFFCDDCHLQIFSTLFGSPQGPLEQKTEMVETPSEGDTEKAYSVTNSSSEWKTIAYSITNSSVNKKQCPMTNLLGLFLFIFLIPNFVNTTGCSSAQRAWMMKF